MPTKLRTPTTAEFIEVTALPADAVDERTDAARVPQAASQTTAVAAQQPAQAVVERRQQQAVVAVQPLGEGVLPRSLAECIQIGSILARSGYFGSPQAEAQAVAKVIAGAELGLTAMTSLNNIHAIPTRNGTRLQFGYQTLLALVRRSRDYDYDATTNNEAAAVTIYRKEGGKRTSTLGVSSFTRADAERAGLIDRNPQTYGGYPRNMFLARAVSNAVDWFCPDVVAMRAVGLGELDEEVALPPAADLTPKVVDEAALAALESAEPEDPFSE